ncbi:MAG: helix-turn-helix domain-containing protein [Bacillota bacterium]
MSIGARLVELRKKKGLSQAALSKQLGINRSTYAEWEIGRRRPELDSLIKLAEFYGISTDFILGLDRASRAAGHDDSLSDLPEEARKSVEEFIEFVRNRYRNT